jgi:hypothetical protein
MTITALPSPPSRTDPTNFSSEGDAFLGALPTFVTEANALAVAMNLNDTTDTSATSNAIGTGAKTFTVTAGKSFQPGMWLVIADTAAPSTNAMHGTITSYSGTTLVMDIKSIIGSGTKTAWTISQSAPGVHGLPNRNAIINGGFTVNQRVYVSADTLATTVYGHDRWKAGSGGGDYSFTQLAGPTTITIAANKTLIQVVEDKNVYGGSYVLSWTGTCQARYAINSATPAGAYAASPIVISGQTAGTTMSVEFGNGASSGTLGLVQLEISSVATPFEQRPFAQELALCMRYYEKSCDDSLAVGVNDGYGEVSSPGVLANSSTAIVGITYRVPKRTTPTVRIMANDGAAGAGTLNEIRNMNSGGLYTISGIYVTKNTGFKYIGMTDTVTVGNAFEFNWDATAEL